MKKLLRPPVDLTPRRLWLLAAAVFAALPAQAIEPAQWRQRAAFEVKQSGMLGIELAPAVIDGAVPNLADIRLLDPQGRETPYGFLNQPRPAGFRTVAAIHDVRLNDSATVITITTGTAEPLSAVRLETAPGDFLKPAKIEISKGRDDWQVLATGVPLYHKNGAAQLMVPLRRMTAAFVRVTLDDTKTPPLAITGVSLDISATVVPLRTLSQPVTVRQREEFSGETVLTLDLGASHLTLTSLEFTSDEPVFSRMVTLAERQIQNETVVERVIARGTLARGPDATAGAPAVLTLNVPSASRELILHVDNGDSPPLPVSSIQARRLPRTIVFNAQQAGAWTLLVGNAAALPPRYDLAAFANATPATTPVVVVAAPAVNPDYKAPPEALAGVPLAGAPLDTLAWKFKRPVVLAGDGVQQLELDLGIVARARADFADIRLVSDGKQIPFLLESTSLSREFDAVITSDDDPRRPRTSRWTLTLPQAGLPLRRVVVGSLTPLFQRRVRLIEELTDDRGQKSARVLADTIWTRQPGQTTAGQATTGNLVLPLDFRTTGAVLTLEADNDDNPPIVLSSARGAVGVTRLYFKPAPGTTAPEIIYGNPQAVAPRYDLALVAPQMLRAPKGVAKLGAETPTAAALDLFSGRSSTIFFWGVLLLVVVARLLPKPAAGETKK
ncbi:MAG: DUF3999 family protein [Opitutaceae bacterium]|jgi:hypothetical protein